MPVTGHENCVFGEGLRYQKMIKGIAVMQGQCAKRLQVGPQYSQKHEAARFDRARHFVNIRCKLSCPDLDGDFP